ncbi:hypothetical protein AAG906_012272 [Vitis piasezkii]
MVRRKSGEDLFGSARWHFHVAGFIGTPQHPHTNCLFIISILHFSLCLTPSTCSPIVHRIGCQCAQLNTMDCKSLLVLGLVCIVFAGVGGQAPAGGPTATPAPPTPTTPTASPPTAVTSPPASSPPPVSAPPPATPPPATPPPATPPPATPPPATPPPATPPPATLRPPLLHRLLHHRPLLHRPLLHLQLLLPQLLHRLLSPLHQQRFQRQLQARK